MSNEPGLDATADDAVHEAELLARVLNHPGTPSHIKLSIRLLMVGACGRIKEQLLSHDTDSEMVFDLYPYARLACVEPMAAAFSIVFDEIVQEHHA